VVYRLVYHRWFEKSFAKLARGYQEKIDGILIDLSESPPRVVGKSKPIRGYSGVYRYRLGKFRLIYVVDEKRCQVIVLGVGSRGKVYKTMQRILR